MSRVLLNKMAIVHRCLNRINEEYTDFETLQANFTKQDAIILNLERACQACIDAALHVVKEKKLGIPQNSKEAFQILEKERIIDSSLSISMQNMVGFRNIAIHEYQSLKLEILNSIITSEKDELSKFMGVLVKVK
jgi:uncharacterized protein YutE (UPF0331/DUF86 family)